MRRYDILSSRACRVDAPAKAAGRAVYADDIDIPAMLHGAILQSPIAHGRIKRLDVSRAEALPGVRAVITADQAPQVRFGVSPARYDEAVFARQRVIYLGDEIAAVAAEDRETALEAVRLMDVEFEELPVILDAEIARSDDAPQIHSMFPGNISAEVHQEFGDVAEARKSAHLTKKGTLESEMQSHAFMEPQSAIARFDERGHLTLTTSTQSVHYTQRTVAMVLELPMSKVRVVAPSIGGGFGGKAACSTMELATCLLARATKRPVKTTFTRQQVFLHGRARHKFYHEMEVGVDREGRLLFLDHQATLDGGAYSSFGIATAYYAGSLLAGPYKLAHLKFDAIRVVTNKPASGAQRGHGAVIARGLFERLLDEIAEEMELDPVELRLRNMMETGDVTCNDLNMSSLGMRECIQAVRDGSEWAEKRGRLPKGKGIGMACGFFVSGAGFSIYRSETYHSTATVKLQEDGGGALVQTAAVEIGQGSDTTLAMIAAETLGIPLEDVRIVSGDSDLGVDLGAYSSRQTLMSGHAVREAAEAARKKVVEVLAEKLGVKPEEITIRRGRVGFREGLDIDIDELRQKYRKEHRGWTDNPEQGELTFREASRIAFLEIGTVVGVGKYRPPFLGGKFKGAAVGTSPAYGCSAQVVELSVDLETGEITVESVTAAHDCGKAINTTSVEGQMEGSFSMGMGEALYEAVRFGPDGRILNSNLADYKIPTALDTPKMKTIVVETNEPRGPYGAKEVGEGAIMPAIPAILNALYDATGIRFEKLPVTAERVVTRLRGRKD